MPRMRRAILAAGVVLLAAACGASGGGAGSPAQPGQQVRAQPVVQGEPVTVQAQPAAAPSRAPAPAQPVLPAPAPTSSGPSGGPGAPIGDDGPNRPCPVGSNPSLHKMCPV